MLTAALSHATVQHIGQFLARQRQVDRFRQHVGFRLSSPWVRARAVARRRGCLVAHGSSTASSSPSAAVNRHITRGSILRASAIISSASAIVDQAAANA